MILLYGSVFFLINYTSYFSSLLFLFLGNSVPSCYQWNYSLRSNEMFKTLNLKYVKTTFEK